MSVLSSSIKFHLAALSILFVVLLSGCGGGGGSSGAGDWYYHFICNGDSQCLQLNFTPAGTPSGTSGNLGSGPGGVSGCNSLLTFGIRFWNIPPAQQWCDHSPTLTLPPPSVGPAPSITGFTPASGSPGSTVT